MADFTEQVTAMTLTNEEGDSMIIKKCDDDHDVIEIHIDGSEFWFHKKDGGAVSRCIESMWNDK